MTDIVVVHYNKDCPGVLGYCGVEGWCAGASNCYRCLLSRSGPTSEPCSGHCVRFVSVCSPIYPIEEVL